MLTSTYCDDVHILHSYHDGYHGDDLNDEKNGGKNSHYYHQHGQ